jgi:protein TonB
VRVAQSLGLGLDEKALEAVRQWRFEPGRLEGRAVAVVVNIQVNFRLY